MPCSCFIIRVPCTITHLGLREIVNVYSSFRFYFLKFIFSWYFSGRDAWRAPWMTAPWADLPAGHASISLLVFAKLPAIVQLHRGGRAIVDRGNLRCARTEVFSLKAIRIASIAQARLEFEAAEDKLAELPWAGILNNFEPYDFRRWFKGKCSCFTFSYRGDSGVGVQAGTKPVLVVVIVARSITHFLQFTTWKVIRWKKDTEWEERWKATDFLKIQAGKDWVYSQNFSAWRAQWAWYKWRRKSKRIRN